MTKKNHLHISSQLNKKIMSELRGGDYQHPGSEEAIELTFQNIKKKPNQLLLDVGCGLGGTAAYIQKKEWGRVVGVDVECDTIQIARNKYSPTLDYSKKINIKNAAEPVFLCGDIFNLNHIISKKLDLITGFDIIFIFGSLCLLPNHMDLLQKLNRHASESAKLVIFDYIDYGDYGKHRYKENGITLIPNSLQFSKIDTIFPKSGWELTKLEIINDIFIQWYRELIITVEKYEEKYANKYGHKDFTVFKNRYKHILKAFEDRILGGVIINASLKKIESV